MRRLLIIENDTIAAAKTAASLKAKIPDLRIDICDTGAEVGRFLRKNRYDLVIADQGISGSTDFVLSESLNTENRKLPMIVISDRCREGPGVDFSNSVDHIIKDEAYPGSLSDRVERVLSEIGKPVSAGRELMVIRSNEENRDMLGLAGALNHEINNPLMAIICNIRILLSKPEIDSASLARKLRIIEGEAERIARITSFIANQNIISGKNISTSQAPKQAAATDLP